MTRIREKKHSENPSPTLQPRGWGTPRLCTLAETIEVVRSLRARCQQIQTASTRPPAAPAGSFSSDFSLPGDILAEAIQYSDASGHVGIIVNNLQHQTASADSTTSCDFSGLPAGVITITDYGFRPDNYLRICHMQSGDIQLTHGQKRYAVVKRFFGQ